MDQQERETESERPTPVLEEPEVDFLADIEAADPESFNVCTFGCD